jgi:hypothetical protein
MALRSFVAPPPQIRSDSDFAIILSLIHFCVYSILAAVRITQRMTKLPGDCLKYDKLQLKELSVCLVPTWEI